MAKQVAVAVLLVAVLGVAARMAFRQREPVFEGKRLSVWLREANGVKNAKVIEAVEQIGTNGIPTLLNLLRKRDSSLTSRFAGLWRKHISGIQNLPNRLRNPAWCQNQAAYKTALENCDAALGFEILGPQAKSAAPELIRIYQQNLSSSSRLATTSSLFCIGPPAIRMAIPLFLEEATSTNGGVRWSAVGALSRIRTEPSLIIPALEQSLGDSYPLTRETAAGVLGSTVRRPTKPFRGWCDCSATP